MNFTKNQLIAFSVVAAVLSVLLVTSSTFSAFVTMRYVEMLNEGSPASVVVVEPGTTAPSGSAVTNSNNPAATSPVVGTSTIGVINAATTAPSGGSSGGSANTPTTAPAQQGAPVDNGKPDTVEEIIALYKTANNNARTKASTVTKTYNNDSNYKEFVEAGALSSVGKLLMGMFLAEKELNEVHTDDIADCLPPGGSNTDNLTADIVASATCEDQGDFYFVTITLVPDVNPEKGKGSGALCTIIEEKSIYDAASAYVDMSNIKCEYDGAYAEAKIEKSTSNLTELYTRLPMYLGLTAKKGFIGPIDAKVGLQFEQRFTIAY